MADTNELMEFLEKTLPQIVTPTTQTLYAIAIDEDGTPKTVYYHCSPLDRATVLGAIFVDAVVAFIKDNTDMIIDILNGEEDDDG